MKTLHKFTFRIPVIEVPFDEHERLKNVLKRQFDDKFLKKKNSFLLANLES